MEEVHSTYQMVKGLHRYTLEGYSVYKGIWCGAVVYSSPFTVGAHQWAIGVYPNGTFSHLAEDLPQYVGFRVCLLSETKKRVTAFLSITLLDQTGQGNHRSRCSFPNSKGPLKFSRKQHLGFPTFITQEALADSCYLKDDCLKIECRLAVLLPSETKIQIERSILQCGFSDDDDDDDDDVSDFRAILESGEGSDVTIHVGEMRFEVHKVILAACSSYFNSLLDSRNDHVKILLTDIEPQVFKAMLHFIYTDALPADERPLVAGFAFGPGLSTTMEAKLLAAADEYGLKRLKSICESHLWRSINLNRLAETLALAKRYHASKLEDLCLQFALDNTDALKELGTLAYFENNYPSMFKTVDGGSDHGHSSSELGLQERKFNEKGKRPAWDCGHILERLTSKLRLSSVSSKFKKLGC